VTAGQLALVVATVLCALGFAALCVVLLRVLDTLGSLRGEVAELRAETRPLLAELRTSVDAARGQEHGRREPRRPHRAVGADHQDGGVRIGHQPRRAATP
jgi:hypothetical protein